MRQDSAKMRIVRMHALCYEKSNRQEEAVDKRIHIYHMRNTFRVLVAQKGGWDSFPIGEPR